MEIVMKKPTVPGTEKPGCEHPPVYRGKPGPQGPAGTIEIAQVVTIEPSDPARVENIGDSTNAKLVLYIPKGDPGNRGEPGPAVEITEDIIQAITNELDLTPALVGLGNVDNTSDIDKPVSTAQAEAIEEVRKGAAPAGFGLGGKAVVIDSLDNAVGFGVYQSSNGTPTASLWDCLNIPNSATYATQIAVKSNSSRGSWVCFRKKQAGVWGEWDHFNPPMELGVEYRTTERINGVPVYTQLFDCGVCINASKITTNISNAKRYAAWMSNGIALPYSDGGDWFAKISTNSGYVEVWMNGFTNQRIYVQLWYLKS